MIRVAHDRRDRLQRARYWYESAIRDKVEPMHHGEFVVVDIDSGDFEVGTDKLAAADRLKERRPEASLFLLRVGFPTAIVVGGRSVAETR